jgi:type IV pilus assembly protein PilY1
VDFLRGAKSNEGVKSTNFRVRAHTLGDIVASAAVPVGAPNQPYDDAGNPGYVAFKATNKTRTPAVYVGANDGLLHALDDSSGADAGKETWAYVPRALFLRC